MAEALILAMLALVAADLRAHARVETLGGLNRHGYRGPVALQRQPNELRVAIAGGTRAFGWGEPPSSSIAAGVRFELARVLDRPGRPPRPVVGINLGGLGRGPESYPQTLDRYAYLHPDYIVIVDDLGETGPNAPFIASGVFRLTGYQPMLPLVLSEKGRTMRVRAIGAPVEFAGESLAFADCMLAAVARRVEDPAPDSPEAYAAAMMKAIDAAHREARGVVLALSPIDTDGQRRNADALWATFSARPKTPWLRVVDLSEQTDLYDPSVRLDGFSFGAGGTAIAARAIAPALLDLIPSR